MGLKESVDWNEAQIVSQSSSKRNLRDAGESFYNLEETIEREERVVYAVSDAASKSAVENGPAGTGGWQYEYSRSADHRKQLKSYTVRRSGEKKSIDFVDP